MRSRWVWGPTTGPTGPMHTTDIAMDQIKLWKNSQGPIRIVVSDAPNTHLSLGSRGEPGKHITKAIHFLAGCRPKWDFKWDIFHPRANPIPCQIKKLKMETAGRWFQFLQKKCDGLATINPFHMIPFCVATTQELAKKQLTRQSPNHRTHRTHRTCGTWLSPGQDQRYRVSAHSTTHVTKMETKITAKNLSST